MGKIKKFDKKSELNRVRVRNYRRRQKIRSSYESQVREQIFKLNTESDIVHTGPSNNDEDFEKHAYDSDNTTIFKDKLKYWAVHHRISASAINDLLAILIYAGFTFLPKDSRTFMRTPSNLSIQTLSNGRFWYYGIQKCITDLFSKLSRDITITLDMNFDGFPVSKSSNSQFWPILAAIRGNSNAYMQTKQIDPLFFLELLWNYIFLQNSQKLSLW